MIAYKKEAGFLKFTIQNLKLIMLLARVWFLMKMAFFFFFCNVYTNILMVVSVVT